MSFEHKHTCPEKDDLEFKIESLESENRDLRNDISNLEDRIEYYKDVVDNLKNDINSLESRLDDFR